MNFTDTHTHLYAKDFDADRDQVIQHAIDSGIGRLFLPNIDSSSVEGMLELVKKYPQNCFPMMGLHPCSVKQDYRQELKNVEDRLKDKSMNYCAVGEIGLDFYWDRTFMEEQKKALHLQIELALRQNLPVILHVRNAFKETFEIVKSYSSKNLRGIFHCFSGTIEDARQVISLGTFKLGIGGVVTFKNGGLKELIPEIPLDYMVLETDSPYLAPVPYRGKRNESAYLTLVAQQLADLKNCSLEQIVDQTTKNSIDIFGL